MKKVGRFFSFVINLTSLTIISIFTQSCGAPRAEPTGSYASASVGTRPPYAANQVLLNAASSRQINISWADNSSDETGFKIERALSNAGPAMLGTSPGTFAAVATVQANTTTFSDTTVVAGTYYYYRIYAVNLIGSSAPTIVANIHTPAAAVVAPTAPSGLSAVAAAATIINVSWLDNSVNETSFSLERSSDNGANFTLIASITANTSSYQDINLLEQKAYIYRVKALNDAGASASTANVTATTLAAGNTASYAYLNTNIFVPNCVKCHGSGTMAAGVNLSTYNGVRAALVAGAANSSKIYTEVNTGKMPPAGPLSALQITAIRNWIDAGALNN